MAKIKQPAPPTIERLTALRDAVAFQLLWTVDAFERRNLERQTGMIQAAIDRAVESVWA